jgi:hypothetical protein
MFSLHPAMEEIDCASLQLSSTRAYLNRLDTPEVRNDSRLPEQNKPTHLRPTTFFYLQPFTYRGIASTTDEDNRPDRPVDTSGTTTRDNAALCGSHRSAEEMKRRVPRLQWRDATLKYKPIELQAHGRNPPVQRLQQQQMKGTRLASTGTATSRTMNARRCLRRQQHYQVLDQRGSKQLNGGLSGTKQSTMHGGLSGINILPLLQWIARRCLRRQQHYQDNRSARRGLRHLLLPLRMHGGVSGIDDTALKQYCHCNRPHGGVSGGRTLLALQEWVH